MKNILYYCHVFYPQNSGYSNAFQNLINSVLDQYDDIKITVVTPYLLGENEELEHERLDVIRLKTKVNIKKIGTLINDYFYAKYVSKKFINEQYDLLFVETFDQPFFINSLEDDVLKKTIVRVHSTNETEYTFFEKSFKYKINKFMIKKFVSHKIYNIASTNSYHINFVKKYYFDDNLIEIGEKNFFIIPNTLNNIVNDYSLDVNNKLKLFMLGRMDRLGLNQKGFLDFIYALILLDNDTLSKYEIVIVGKGEQKSKLIKLTKHMKNITYIDELTHEETLSYLKESDVVVLPSRYEGLSMFALEGLGTGNAVIFSKTGGLIDLVDGNGLFFEPNNIESLVNALNLMSIKEPQEIYNMKKRSLDIIAESFSRQKVAEKFYAVINLIIG